MASVLSDTDPNLQAGSTATRVVSTTQPTGNIEFSLDVKDLRANTKYFVRAYATAQVTNDQPTPKIEYAQSDVVTFTTLAEAVSGSWKELSGLKFTPFGVDFFFDGNFYKQSEQKTLSFSPATLDKQNVGSQFPGTGYVGVFKQIDKKAYALMNYNLGESTKPFNELWEYDLVAKKWIRKADFPGTARLDGITLVINNKLYFGTGNEYTKAKPGFATTLKDWWEYDPATDKWTQKADFPLTAYNLSGFTTGTKAVAGIGLSFNSSINRESWWEYNPQTNTWRTLNKIVGDYSPSNQYVWSELYNGKNYALFPNQARTKYAMWVYNPASENWTRTAELPLNFSAFTAFSGVSVNGKPWLITNSRQSFEFTP